MRWNYSSGPNVNGCIVEVWEWISNSLTHFINGCILGLKLIHVSKRGPLMSSAWAALCFVGWLHWRVLYRALWDACHIRDFILRTVTWLMGDIRGSEWFIHWPSGHGLSYAEISLMTRVWGHQVMSTRMVRDKTVSMVMWTYISNEAIIYTQHVIFFFFFFLGGGGCKCNNLIDHGNILKCVKSFSISSKRFDSNL